MLLFPPKIQTVATVLLCQCEKFKLALPPRYRFSKTCLHFSKNHPLCSLNSFYLQIKYNIKQGNKQSLW